ncbi:DEKNAAC100818 [Brettanomyces naardenensis]|uniref:DEKNAAC100818 n=1 Tax=Brettanomyces naardenensis TaxID=13370 RepID=A0A448YFY0_BRENA|nr:DEKNAAC100818 [Brettanomyces naardenensis]
MPTAGTSVVAAAVTSLDTTSANNTASNGQVEELYPIALLMDELRHDDVAARVQAMKRLDTISIALGAERTRKELVPFLEDVIPEDEDEVIAIAAEELGKFVPLVGGSEFAPILIPVLEKIAACEEPIVREKAIDSLNSVATSLSDEQIQQEFIPLLQRLAKERWFSLHIAATGLFKSVIVRVPSDMRSELLKMYFDLIQDDSPMVRKAAATELPEIVDLLGERFNKPETVGEFHWDIVTSMYENLVNDNQDSVKFLAVDVLIAILAFLKRLGDKSHHEELFESLLALINDPSWRVRYMVADRFDKLAQNFDDDGYTLKLVPNLLSLMKDNEAEVRKAVSKQLPGFCTLANKADRSIMLEDIVPVISQLSMDESETVRSALASEITGLAPIFGKEATIKHLLPIFVEMLKDEFSEVRLNIISKLQVVNEVIGIQLLSESLLPAITSLSNDKLWRVRLAIIEQIPLLAEQLGVAFFDEALGQLCMEWLWDPVYSIREAAVLNLQKLTKFFGEDWCKEELIKRIMEKKQTKDFDNFICRITCLLALDKLIPVVSAKTVSEDIYPFVNDLKDDQVPNIRFNVAKSLASIAEKLYPEYSSIVTDKIRPTLERLQEDDDVDVRFYTEQSLERLSKLLTNSQE